MTIVTKPNTEKKADKSLEKPLVVNGGPTTESVSGRSLTGDPSIDDVEAWLSSTTRRRVSTTTTVCVFITSLLVMSIGIIGGVYVYRQFTERQMSRFRGWCGIPFEQDQLAVIKNNDRILGPNRPFFKEYDELVGSGNGLFKEEFDLDLDSELYEDIFVPDFGYGRQGRFVHDFKQNKTVIVDASFGRCFVMPLDREHVLPPRDLFDVIRKLWMGYYTIDTAVVRKTMRVVQPPLRDTSSLGHFITQSCSKYPIYRLKQVAQPDDNRKKRSTAAASLSQDTNSITLAAFAGKNIVELNITHLPEGNKQQ